MRADRTARAVAAVLLALAALGLLVRVTSIPEPLGIDQGFWASAAHQMHRGQALYRDVWDHKPPASFLTYLAAFRLLGWHASSVAWFDIFASALTTLLLFVVGRRLGGLVTGAATAAIYSTMTVPSWLYRHDGFLERSVAETYIVILAGASAWCALALRDRPRRTVAAALGCCSGIAFLYKPNAAIYLPAMLLWIGLYPTWPRAQFVRVAVVASAAAAVPPVLIGIWLWQTGVLSDARIALVDFNTGYVSQGLTVGGYALSLSKALWLRMKTEPLWAAGSLGAVVAVWDLFRTRRLDPLPGLAVIWGVAAAIALVANGVWLFNSYFIHALPPLALMSGWLLARARRAHVLHRIATLTAVTLGVLLLAERNYFERVHEYAGAGFEQLRGDGNRAAYLERFGSYANSRGYSARANDELAAYLRTRVTPADRLYFFGINFSGIYFATDTLMANRFLRANVFVPSVFPYPGYSLADVIGELEQRRPLYLIFETLHSPSAMGVAVDALQQDPAVRRLLGSYRLETTIEDFAVYRRAD
jgi:4-amino-4-deoxy-L-arabinose transferase-like glycosyltransferase